MWAIAQGIVFVLIMVALLMPYLIIKKYGRIFFYKIFKIDLITDNEKIEWKLKRRR